MASRQGTVAPSGTVHNAMREAARRIAGAEVIQIEQLPGGASLRRYHRVTIPGGMPSTLVVMELGDERKPEEVTQGESGRDLPFVDVLRYLERGGIGVPHLYEFDEPGGLLYLEDLGDRTFESEVSRPDDTRRRLFYRTAIDDLVALQRYALANPRGCVAFTRAFDRNLLRWELDHFREWGLEAGAGATLSSSERAELDRQFDAIAERLAAVPRVFVHRDYQSRNLMVQGSADRPRLRLIDFQDALCGTRAYDLVALLRDSYVVLSMALVDELVDYFADRSNLDRGPFRTLFDLQTTQRKLKDAGRFVYIDRVKKKPGFLESIPASHGYVRAALERLPELASLREILARHIVDFR